MKPLINSILSDLENVKPIFNVSEEQEKTMEITIVVKVPKSFSSYDESILDVKLSDAIEDAGYTCVESKPYMECD